MYLIYAFQIKVLMHLSKVLHTFKKYFRCKINLKSICKSYLISRKIMTQNCYNFSELYKNK